MAGSIILCTFLSVSFGYHFISMLKEDETLNKFYDKLIIACISVEITSMVFPMNFNQT